MSSPDQEGNERRMLMVCMIKTPKQNNWMRTQYIPVNGATRIYIEVEFSIRYKRCFPFQICHIVRPELTVITN